MKKLNLIFLSSLLLILILGTTSFALTDLNDMSEETMQNIIDYCMERQTNETYLDILENVNLKMLSNFWNETLAPSMANAEPIEALEQLLITYNAENNRILIYYTNNTIGNSLRQAKVEYMTGSGYNQYVIKNTGESFFGITINSTSSFTNYKNSGGFLKLGNDITINENNSTISFPTIRSMGYGASVDFLPKDSTQTYQFFLVPSITITGTSEPLPTPTPTPTPDSGGGDSGGTGGDTGGGTTTPDYNENLNNIQSGITDINNNLNNIQENIPTSGEIAGATTQGNKDYWGNSDEMNEEDYENQINDGINDSMNEISEELEQNEVFNSIAVAEQKIIDLFLEEPEDFKISWQDVKYMEKTLVPAGEINFSQLCRENETLGRVKNILNIIVSAMISLALFKQIFNLIMVTLGIDHPLVLETEKDDITEISSTRIGNKTYVTKKTYKSDKKGAR